MDTRYCNIWTPSGSDCEAEWLAKRKELLTASDVSVALGHNSYKTPIELWREKTGRTQPKDLSDNPAVIYGKENEARIRGLFIEESSDWCDVDYHQYDIYTSKKDPWLGATLDGEIHVTNDDNPYAQHGVQKGDWGVLEIKTGGFYSLEDLEKRWNECPLAYTEQVRTQMYVTGATFAILKAELTYKGKESIDEDKKVVFRKYFFKFDMRQENLILEGCLDFWDHVKTDRIPSQTLIQAEPTQDSDIPALTDIRLEADATIGYFTDNFDMVKDAVVKMVEPYKGLVLTEADAKEAKGIKADLNKKLKAIKDTRIAVKKKYCAPLEVFESKAKELEQIISDAIAPLTAQLNYFDEQEKKQKMEKIDALIQETAQAALTDKQSTMYLEHFVNYDDRWLNKSKTMKSIKEEIEAQVESFASNLGLIVRHADGNVALESMMIEAFISSKDVGRAFEAEDRYREAEALRKEREERRIAHEKMLAEQRAREAEERNMAQPQPTVSRETVQDARADEPAPQVEAEPAAGEQDTQPARITMLRYTFEAEHSSVKEWKDLLQYMKDHGFRFRKIN